MQNPVTPLKTLGKTSNMRFKIPKRPYTVNIENRWYYSHRTNKRTDSWQVTSILEDKWFGENRTKAFIYFIKMYFKCLFFALKSKRQLLWKRSSVCETIYYENNKGEMEKGRTICPDKIDTYI